MEEKDYRDSRYWWRAKASPSCQSPSEVVSRTNRHDVSITAKAFLLGLFPSVDAGATLPASVRSEPPSHQDACSAAARHFRPECLGPGRGQERSGHGQGQGSASYHRCEEHAITTIATRKEGILKMAICHFGRGLNRKKLFCLFLA